MYLLYHRKSAPTGRIIAAALGVSHGFGFPQDEGEALPSFPLIRWGSRAIVESHTLGDKVINTQSSLAMASDKLTSLVMMKDNGVSVPDFSTDPLELKEEFGWPLMGRNINHVKGQDIILCLQERDLRRKRDFYTRYIPTKREYRLHVAFGEVIRVQGKYLDNQAEAQSYVRNHRYGYRFRSPRRRLNSDRYEMAIKALETLGLDFGAVDLIVSDDRKAYVLEVNTAPSCSPLTARAYVNAIANHLEIPSHKLNLGYLNMLSDNEESADEEVYDGEEDFDA